MGRRDIAIDKIEEDLNLLIRQIKMLRVTKENQPVGIIRLSEMTDIPKHKIRYSLRLLEKDGAIAPSPGGAIVTDMYDSYMRGTLDRVVKLRSSLKMIEDMIKDSLE